MIVEYIPTVDSGLFISKKKILSTSTWSRACFCLGHTIVETVGRNGSSLAAQQRGRLVRQERKPALVSIDLGRANVAGDVG